jgi:CRISPR-associated protein Cmr3
MSKYLITLKPTGKFFFGSEMTFQVGNDEKDPFNKQFASYIIESSKFPQQTSLLGMLRFLLLRKSNFFDLKNNRIKNPNDSNLVNLIGKSSFAIGNTDGYGKIREIYPCFLMRGKEKVILLPKDCGSEDKGGIKKIVLCDKTYHYNKRTIGIEKILRYPKKGESKKEKEKYWIAKDGLNTWYWDGKELLEVKDIYIEDQRIGINRNIKTGKTQDNALFKQVNYRLADGFYFAFYAEIDGINFSQYKDEIVSIGADNSLFKIDIEGPVSNAETSMVIPSKYQPKLEGAYGKIVLISPSYIPDNVLENACFSITETIPFKFMQTTIETKDYSRLGREINHSNRYELYQTGSVFYFRTEKEMEDFKTGVEKRTDFRQIGYNYVKELIENNQ